MKYLLLLLLSSQAVAIDIKAAPVNGQAITPASVTTSTLTVTGSSTFNTLTATSASVATFTSSVTVTGAGGVGVTYGVTAATAAITYAQVSSITVSGYAVTPSGNYLRMASPTTSGGLQLTAVGGGPEIIAPTGSSILYLEVIDNNSRIALYTANALNTTFGGSSGGNVGVNVVPTALLEMKSKSAPSGYVLAVDSQNATVGGMLSVLGNGSVGIGTANPVATLTVSTTGISPAATFSPALSSNTVSASLSGTFTNTTLGACIASSTQTLTLPSGGSGNVLITLNGTASVNSLAAVIGAGVIVDGAYTNGETTAKGLTAPQEAVSTDGTGMSFATIITGLSAASHNFCLSLFVSAGTGTIDSTTSAMQMHVVMLP